MKEAFYENKITPAIFFNTTSTINLNLIMLIHCHIKFATIEHCQCKSQQRNPGWFSSLILKSTIKWTICIEVPVLVEGGKHWNYFVLLKCFLISCSLPYIKSHTQWYSYSEFGSVSKFIYQCLSVALWIPLTYVVVLLWQSWTIYEVEANFFVIQSVVYFILSTQTWIIPYSIIPSSRQKCRSL